MHIMATPGLASRFDMRVGEGLLGNRTLGAPGCAWPAEPQLGGLASRRNSGAARLRSVALGPSACLTSGLPLQIYHFSAPTGASRAKLPYLMAAQSSKSPLRIASHSTRVKSPIRPIIPPCRRAKLAPCLVTLNRYLVPRTKWPKTSLAICARG